MTWLKINIWLFKKETKVTILQILTVSQRIPQNFKGKPLNYLMDTQITYLHKSLEDRDEGSGKVKRWFVSMRLKPGDPYV